LNVEPFYLFSKTLLEQIIAHLSNPSPTLLSISSFRSRLSRSIIGTFAIEVAKKDAVYLASLFPLFVQIFELTFPYFPVPEKEGESADDQPTVNESLSFEPSYLDCELAVYLLNLSLLSNPSLCLSYMGFFVSTGQPDDLEMGAKQSLKKKEFIRRLITIISKARIESKNLIESLPNLQKAIQNQQRTIQLERDIASGKKERKRTFDGQPTMAEEDKPFDFETAIYSVSAGRKSLNDSLFRLNQLNACIELIEPLLSKKEYVPFALSHSNKHHRQSKFYVHSASKPLHKAIQTAQILNKIVPTIPHQQPQNTKNNKRSISQPQSQSHSQSQSYSQQRDNREGGKRRQMEPSFQSQPQRRGHQDQRQRFDDRQDRQDRQDNRQNKRRRF
jgi:hypothetical protein